jgi:Ca-activated chloride channel family protein
MLLRSALAMTLLAAVACTPGRAPQARTPEPGSPLPVATPTPTPNPTVDGPGAPTPKPPTAPLVVAGGDPKPVHATSPALGLTVLPQFGAILPAVGELNVLLRLKGGDMPETQRPPLDLALVIDRSGSMQGDKIVSVKTAAIELLSRLGRDDRLSILSYSNGVEVLTRHVLMNDAGQREARKHILGIDANGSTALGPAMAEAFSVLRQRPAAGSDRMAHVIFMSDGLANTGEQRPAILGEWAAAAFRDGISLSSLGVGLDYNEDLMTKIADQGGGRYHFIKDADAVAGVLNDEFKGLVATVASQVAIQVDLPEGARLLRVFGYPTFEEGGKTFIRVGSVAAQGSRDIIVKLGFDRPMGADGAAVAVAGLRVDFRNMAAGGEAAFVTGAVDVQVRDDAKAIAASENLEVSVRVSETEAADKLETAARAVETGAYQEAEKVLEDTIVELRKRNEAAPSPVLDAQIKDFETARRGVQGAAASPAAKGDFVKTNKARAYETQKK